MMRWRDDQPRSKGVTTWIVGSVLVVAWVLTSAAPASAYITEPEVRHASWVKLRVIPRATPTDGLYDPTLNTCRVITNLVGECNFTIQHISAKGVEVCIGVLRVTKREYDKPRGYAPKPAPTFKTILVGDITCRKEAS